MSTGGLEYVGVGRIEGPLIVVERTRDVGYDEVVEVKINLTEGLQGDHLYLLPTETATSIAGLMIMGGIYNVRPLRSKDKG